MKNMVTTKCQVMMIGLARVLLISAMVFGFSGCATREAERSISQQGNAQPRTQATDLRDESTIRSSAKHYTDGQAIPGVGTAIGDVYILPDGGCFGGAGKCGIRWANGAIWWFGDTISARTPLRCVQPGSPATK